MRVGAVRWPPARMVGRMNEKQDDVAAADIDGDHTVNGVAGRRVNLLAAVLVLGVVIGVVAGLLTLLLYGIEQVALGFVESPDEPGPFATPAVRRALSVIVGSAIAAVAWWLLRTRATTVPSVTKAVNGARMPGWQTIVHVLLQILIVGTGMSIGREVAPREFGALAGQRASSVFRLDARDTRMVVAIAAGAGLAGVYNAPLAGAFFAVEILLAEMTLEAVGLALTCSAVAAWVATLIKGTHTFYDMGEVDALFTPDLMLFALLAGAVFGVCGALFRAGSSWAERHKASGAAILWQLPLAGVLTGVVAIWVPQVMGNGRATAQMGFGASADVALIGVLLVSCVVKAVMTLLTIRAGASGGVLTPGIALGATIGATLGIVWMQAFGTNAIGVYALMGACALLAASQHAPMMAMCLVMELADAPLNLFVPVSLAVAVSSLVGSWAGERLPAGGSTRAAQMPRAVGSRR